MSALCVFQAARESPDRVALIEGNRQLSFGEVAARAAPRAAALLARRPKALALTPRAELESLLWLYAAFATGTPVLTLHARATPADRSRACASLGASEPPALGQATLEASQLPVVPDDTPLAFIPTSGSSGAPRLVQLSRGAMLASARASEKNLGWAEADRWLLCLPLAHTGGLSIVVRCLAARQSVLLFEPGPGGALANPNGLRQAASQATLVSVVPSLLDTLLDAGFVGSPGLRAVLVGGAGCSPALAERARAAGIPLLTSYGLTETASQVVTRRYAERFEPLPERAGVVSSGHPLPGVELELRGSAIAVRAPSLFSGYFGEAAPCLDADGFLLTNDHGELGERGELYVRGRNDDVIVSSGENVDPLEVEAALRALPGVRAACVFGTPSARFGQVVTAVLLVDDPALGDAAHLAGLLADRLAKPKLPRRVLLTDSLPLTESGKVDRRAARERYAGAFPEAEPSR